MMAHAVSKMESVHSESPETSPQTTNTPLALLLQLMQLQAEGCLQVTSSTVEWRIFFAQGRLIFATHSADPFDRLERNLRRLSHQNSSLTRDIRTQVRHKFEHAATTNLAETADYQAIAWLLKQQYISATEASTLARRSMQEVMDSYLLLATYNRKNFVATPNNLKEFCNFDLQEFIADCYQRINAWKKLGRQVTSTYQRPYFFTNAYAQRNISPEQQEKLGKLLKGFSFRHLSALFNQNELFLIKRLYPLIENGVILLREPQSPFDQLPPLSNPLAPLESPSRESQGTIEPLTKPNGDTLSNLVSDTTMIQQNWKVVCVDDSPTILTAIDRFLDKNNFTVFAINDSLKALMQIIRIRPQLILLDVGMPNIDGYQLCSMLRKHDLFQTTPIIMVTGKTGIVDRAKAKLSGATDYMTKPFTQAELLKMVFRYLT